ncbi:MAG TPA: sodium:proton antiporter [Chitinispirillaceae bacterium]|nr:sodium:proton antiporter [Chitinispirillaceae bacterium]
MMDSGRKTGSLSIGLLFLLLPSLAMASEGSTQVDFPLWSGAFFIGLLLCIAIIPLINGDWWGKYFGFVSIGLAIPAAFIVCFTDWTLLLHVLQEYISFIILLGSLFIIAGGIVIRVGAQGTPMLNTVFLLIGSIFASLIGTTGASMVLLRPLIRSNKWRKHVVHIYIFFIFMVSNIGGLLTPLGDPPLFLGFLKGVPFFWTLRLLPIWAFAIGILLILFFAFDSFLAKKEDPQSARNAAEKLPEKKLEIKGKINFIFLLIVIASFFLPAIPWLRELVMIAAAVLSVFLTNKSLREENAFTYHPIKEVAILFAGIFVTMVPVLTMLQVHGSQLGVVQPWQFFWASGSLSSFLDNAPTYLVFMSTAQSVAHAQGILSGLVVGVPETLLKAISAGSVCMGANSYIGNGPNFMVKAICEENNVRMPSFFGYMAWSIGILIPIFIFITYIFFK